MKRTTLILFTLLITTSLFSQKITGYWYGAIEVQGTQLRLTFNITETDSVYSATMDSPDQGVRGIPVSSISFENPTLKIEITNADLKYEGNINASEVIIGTLTQFGQKFAMNLSRIPVQKKTNNRPQEPTKPYPYYTEDVTFENEKSAITLAGTLTLPKKEGNYPAVILISGSGPQNRDEELLEHKPFLVIADYLTRNGIAVLRYDDRGVENSTGTFENSTTADFASDVESAMTYLKTRKEINKNKIGLIGHSEGGIIAPMIAAQTDDVAFIVLLAGSGIPGDELLGLQQRLMGKASGLSDEQLEQMLSINKKTLDIVKKSDSLKQLHNDLYNFFKQVLTENVNTKKPAVMTDDDFIQYQIDQVANPWMVYFVKHDPAAVLEKVKCPVLALNGEKDLQVPSEVNLNAIKKALEKGGNKNITIKELASLNHLFQECTTGSPAEYAKIEQTFSPKALDEIKNWILSQVK